MNYYNDNDPAVAQWLRNLIVGGMLPPGDVDERSIAEVRSSDLAGYSQVHLFAGIGGWPLALQLAGWPSDRPVWTGSCPCQPYSGAGRGAGDDDPRNLWPHFFRLIATCQPGIIFGEQVASRLGRQWFAGVSSDLASVGYQVAGADLPASAVGAPHIRQRLWWVAERGKDLQQVRTNEASIGVPQKRGLWAIQGCLETPLQGMPESLGEMVASDSRRESPPEGSAPETPGEGRGLCQGICGDTSCVCPDTRGGAESRQTRMGLRLGSTPWGIGREVSGWAMRDVGHSFPDGLERREGLEQPFFGPHQPEGGVLLLQYSGGVPSHEPGPRKLGGRPTPSVDGGVAEQEGVADANAPGENDQSLTRSTAPHSDGSGIPAHMEGVGSLEWPQNPSAASVGAPHIRQRLYWVANAERWATERQRLDLGTAQGGAEGPAQERQRLWPDAGAGSAVDGLDDAAGDGAECSDETQQGGDGAHDGLLGAAGASGGGLGNAPRERLQEQQALGGGADQCLPSSSGAWSNADIVWCDERAFGRGYVPRRVESGIQPLVDGVPFRLADGCTLEGVSRAALLKGLGNAIVPQVAAEFVRAYMEIGVAP